MIKADSVEHIDSIEHSADYYNIHKVKRWDKVNLMHKNMQNDYLKSGTFDKYDLIFVDGRNREQCLDYARKNKMHDKSVLILHDAARKQYLPEISKFPIQDWRDGTHTVILKING